MEVKVEVKGGGVGAQSYINHSIEFETNLFETHRRWKRISLDRTGDDSPISYIPGFPDALTND